MINKSNITPNSTSRPTCGKYLPARLKMDIFFKKRWFSRQKKYFC